MAGKCIHQTVNGEKAKIRKYTDENSVANSTRTRVHGRSLPPLDSHVAMTVECLRITNFQSLVRM